MDGEGGGGAQGWQYKRHDEFFTVLNSARQLSGDTRVRTLGILRTRFTDTTTRARGFLNPDNIGESLDDVELLLDILQPLTEGK